VVTIVDTEGFVPSVTDDVAGGIRAAAPLSRMPGCLPDQCHAC